MSDVLLLKEIYQNKLILNKDILFAIQPFLCHAMEVSISRNPFPIGNVALGAALGTRRYKKNQLSAGVLLHWTQTEPCRNWWHQKMKYFMNYFINYFILRDATQNEPTSNNIWFRFVWTVPASVMTFVRSRSLLTQSCMEPQGHEIIPQMQRK